MVIFHFCYDLRYFGYVNWYVPNGPNWWPFRYLILTLFIFTSGVSLSLAHKARFRQKAFAKRLMQLIAAAILITTVSLFLFPSSWIYFGVLHFIVVATLLGAPLVNYPVIALGVATAILLGFWSGLLPTEWPYVWFSPWLPSDTEDFVPLIPWLGVMYLGVGIAGALPVNTWDLPVTQWLRPMACIGQHGLMIYLLHQPLLFAGFMLVNRIGN